MKFIVPGPALVDYEPKAAKDSDFVEALLDGIITATQATVAEVANSARNWTNQPRSGRVSVTDKLIDAIPADHGHRFPVHDHDGIFRPNSINRW